MTLLVGREIRGQGGSRARDRAATWGTGFYFTKNPLLTAAAAGRLVDRGAAFVGIDSLNIDDDDGRRPAHSLLLAPGITICEHMTNLTALPPEGSASARSR